MFKYLYLFLIILNYNLLFVLFLLPGSYSWHCNILIIQYRQDIPQIIASHGYKMWNNLVLFLSILVLLVQLSSQSAQSSTATQYVYYIFTPSCYRSLVEEFNVTDIGCVKLTISKLLGYALVTGGAIVKVPQLIKILLERSVYGISFTSIFMESMTNWVTIVYSWFRGNPFSIYGENVFILIQNIVIMLLFIVFGRKVPKGVQDPGQKVITRYTIFLFLFCVLMFMTQNPSSWPSTLINYSMFLQIFLFSSARLTQIIHIFRCKSTGSLALITCLLVFLGNLGRLFTVLVQIGNDYIFAASVILASILNGTILVQFFYYWNNTKKLKQKQKQQ